MTVCNVWNDGEAGVGDGLTKDVCIDYTERTSSTEPTLRVEGLGPQGLGSRGFWGLLVFGPGF